MGRVEAMSRLPAPYAAALRLRDEGREDGIADRLGIEPEGVPALIRLAEAKLARLLVTEETT